MQRDIQCLQIAVNKVEILLKKKSRSSRLPLLACILFNEKEVENQKRKINTHRGTLSGIQAIVNDDFYFAECVLGLTYCTAKVDSSINSRRVLINLVMKTRLVSRRLLRNSRSPPVSWMQESRLAFKAFPLSSYSSRAN